MGGGGGKDSHLNFHTAPEFVHSMLLYVHRDHRDRGESMTATLTFTQLLSSFVSSSSMLLYVHRDHKDYYGQGAQNSHFDCCS